LPVRALAAALLLLAGACAAPQQGMFTPAPIVPEVSLDVEGVIDPSQTFTISAVDGILEQVSVMSDRGTEASGDFSDDFTSWTSEGHLYAGAEYSVSAMAVSEDATVTEFSGSFSTTAVEGSGFAVADVTPVVEGETLGVGAPIIVTFTQAAPDRASVEKQLRVESEKGHEGAWRWISDTQVIYRTKEYWEPYQAVTFTADLEGVWLAEGVWGSKSHTATLQIGRSQVSMVDLNAHTMTVEFDGEVERTLKISGGSGARWEYYTATGVHLVMEKFEVKRMIAPGREPDDPEYYDEMVDWAVRINSTGEFVHSAPWSIWAQGSQNVSHGCVNAHPDDAKWFYQIAQRGDPVDVEGSPRAMPWDNGWGYWIMSFEEWQEGSALT
jgi:lipoprotein-anchoring transpeptidase ErfK/SrfK